MTFQAKSAVTWKDPLPLMEVLSLRRSVLFVLLFILIYAGHLVLAYSFEEKAYTNDEIGISLRLPNDKWVLIDQSQGAVKVLIFSPKEDMSTRCCVLYFPAGAMPEGVLTRESHLKPMLGELYNRVAYEKDMLGGKEADRLDYAVKGNLTKEYGLRDGDFYLIFQLSAPDGDWESEEMGRKLEAIKESFAFTGEANIKEPTTDLKTPAQVRELRRSLKDEVEEQDFEVERHVLAVKIDPPKQTLRASDRITVRSKRDGLNDIVLYFTLVSVQGVEPSDRVTWKTKTGPQGTSELRIEFERPLNAGETMQLEIGTGSDDFFQTVDQTLVQEIAVLGQVREHSCYSSHVVYYPIDERNDAAMEMAFTVPEGYTAVTGGEPMGEETAGGWTTVRYGTEVRVPRALPFGFAVGRFIEAGGVSPSGLPITVYGYPGEETLVRQRLDVALEAAGLFEKMMGPLPFEAVRIAHVTPEKKEMGVSLPGLILASDGFFHDFKEIDLSDGNLERKDAMDLLLIVDELNHQWNFYASPLPNELAEGVSTFANILFVEHRHGKEAYRNGIQYCRRAYLMISKMDRDVAIADPAIYETTSYRGIAFCKVPAVLDMLRTRLGDETFFKAWRNLFLKYKGGKDGYEVMEAIFSLVSGEDLTAFFDQWFYRAGYPRIQKKLYQHRGRWAVELRQKQQGPVFPIEMDLLILGKAGEELRKKIPLPEKRTIVYLDCDFDVDQVVLDPDGLLLFEK